LLTAGGKMVGERRIVTILMADVKGSSAMSRDLDPEEWLEIMDGAFEVLIAPVARYEGTVARLEGDAILAFFGAPIAHEDDPERACRAGMEIVEGAREYAAQLEVERGIGGFNVRVGIHTGLVVVGEVGADLRMEYTAMGEAPNLTARLESAAEPGTVLISEATHKLIAPLFETQPLEPIQVKGWQEPVPVWRVLQARELPAKVRGIEGLESPLVGREVELAALQAAIKRLRSAQGGIVTVVGEAGIGKSRLVSELRKHAGLLSMSDLRWVEGRCLSYGTSLAYLPWLGVLRSLVAAPAEATPDAVASELQAFVRSVCAAQFEDVYPYLAQMMSLPLEDAYQQELGRLQGQELRTRTFRAVEKVITEAAQRYPLVLLFEDLHWCDATSLALLEHLLPSVRQVPLLIVLIFRPHQEHGSWRLRQAAVEQFAECHADLLLEPLSANDGELLVDNLLRSGDLPEELIQHILERAEGNPFYVEEILRTLLDEGILVADRETGGWQLTRQVDEIAIPDTLQGVLLARIDRLQEDTKRVLQMASVIGRIFLYRLLQAMLEEEYRLDAHLFSLQREEMIRERERLPELEYIFKHELTREAAYNGLLRKQRRLFHRQVAEALEQLFPDRLEEQLGLLAYHWEAAGDAQKAVSYLLRAGQRDVKQFANQEAIAHFTRGLALLQLIPPSPQRIQLEFALQMGIGAPIIAIQGYGAPEVGRAWGRARELAAQMGDPTHMSPARQALNQFYIVRGEHQIALEISREMFAAEEHAAEASDFPLRRDSMGVSCLYLGQIEEARTHLEENVARYDRNKHMTYAYVYGQDLGVLSFSYLAWALWLLGYVDQALERCRQAIELAESLDHPFSFVSGLCITARVYSMCLDIPKTLELTAVAAEVSRQREFMFYQGAALGLLGWAHVQQGAFEQGEAEIRQHLAIWQAAGALFNRPHSLTWLAEALGKMGRIDEGLDVLAEALNQVERTGERYYEAEVRRLQAELLLQKGCQAEAEAGFLQAIQVAREQSAKSLELRAILSLCRLWQSEGKHAEARSLLGEVYAWFSEGFDTPDLKAARALLDEMG
jgi:class 3 adenylate cyclase/tetratricopeptide (TPR) repeat protein